MSASKDCYPYVYILPDGSVREVTELEKLYLQTEFSGGDGARPYIMTSFPTPGSKVHGFCFRQFVPDGVTILAVPRTERAEVAAEHQRILAQGYRVDLKGIDL